MKPPTPISLHGTACCRAESGGRRPLLSGGCSRSLLAHERYGRAGDVKGNRANAVAIISCQVIKSLRVAGAIETSRSPDSSTASAMQPLALPVTNHTLFVNSPYALALIARFKLVGVLPSTGRVYADAALGSGGWET